MSVKSLLNKTIEYKENRNIEPEDLKHQSCFYEMEIYKHPYEIVLGKENVQFSKKGVYYMPFYLVSGTKIKSQLGVFEYPSDKKIYEKRIQPYLDSEGEIDIEKMPDPILFSFVTEKYLKKSGAEIKAIDIDNIDNIDNNMKVNMDTDKQNIEEDEEISDEERTGILQIESSKKSPIKLKTESILKTGVFTIKPPSKPVQRLTEEGEDQAKEAKSEYTESSTNKWINVFTKNNHYDIVDTIANGDCFFDCIRIAFEQIGMITTTSKLRQLVSNEATEKTFENYNEIYLATMGEIQEIETEMKRLEMEYSDIKKRTNKDGITKDQLKRLLDEAKIIKEQRKEKEGELSRVNMLTKEFAFMKGINTLDKFRLAVQKSDFWADTWAINTIEEKLNIKLIILSEEFFEEGDLDSVMQCGQNNNNIDRFEPEYYIIVSHSGDHYRLISYKNKYIFKFTEIPYGIKILIVIKCMERMGATFSLIPDFRNFMSKLGINSDDAPPLEDYDDIEVDGKQLPIFIYYNKSAKIPKPGKGDGERIELTDMTKYSKLNQHKNWRRMLDDDWKTVFVLYDKRWSTVEHYYQAAKFRKKNAKFYEQFSLDANPPSGFEENPDLAKKAGGIEKGWKKYRPENVKIDPDFYNQIRNHEERKRALYAKFSQNADLKTILLETRNAILKRRIHQGPAERDNELMWVRLALQEEELRE
jgi:predicted NAD-dependent protein-ADP-ribosyltransferase YbiA (DUF1768 family)